MKCSFQYSTLVIPSKALNYMKVPILKKIVSFYFDGFKNVSVTSRKLWIIIFVKLFIMFAILKLFFFPDFLKTKFKTNTERSNYVIEQLTQTKK